MRVREANPMEKEKHLLAGIVIAVIVVLFLLGGLGMGGYGMMGFGMGFGFLFLLLFLGAIVFVMVTLINSSRTGTVSSDPLVTLKNRYAQGDITKKQYEEMKKELSR